MKAKLIPINWNPEMSIFASEPFQKAVGDEYGWIGGFEHSGELRCILPYTIVKKAIFRMARFRVETIPIGEDFTVEEERSFLNSVVTLLKSIGADMIIPASANAIFRVYPDGALVARYGSYVLDLTKPEQVLWNNLHAKHRNKIRKARKENVEIVSGKEYMKVAYDLISQTLERSQLRFIGYDAFEELINGLDKFVKIFVCFKTGIPQGCAVVPFSFHSAYYLYGGSAERPTTGANNLLQWEAICQFRELGVRRYDFVGVRINPKKGSKQKGLETFKKRFGGELHKGYMWKYPINRLKYCVYKLAIRTLRGGDIVDQENATS